MSIWSKNDVARLLDEQHPHCQAIGCYQHGYAIDSAGLILCRDCYSERECASPALAPVRVRLRARLRRTRLGQYFCRQEPAR
jgi:hypothetical protein